MLKFKGEEWVKVVNKPAMKKDPWATKVKNGDVVKLLANPYVDIASEIYNGHPANTIVAFVSKDEEYGWMPDAWIEIAPKECTCNKTTLLNEGCVCNAFLKERSS